MASIQTKPRLVVTSSSNYWEATTEANQVGFSAFHKAKEQLGDQVEIGGVNFHEPSTPKLKRIAKRAGMIGATTALAGVGLAAAGTVSFGIIPAAVTAAVGLGVLTQKNEIANIRYNWNESNIELSNFKYESESKFLESAGRIGLAAAPALVAGGLMVAGIATGGILPAALLGATGLGLAAQAKPLLANAKGIIQDWKTAHAPLEEQSTEPVEAPKEKTSSKILQLIGKVGATALPGLIGGGLLLAGVATAGIAPALIAASGMGLMASSKQLKARVQDIASSLGKPVEPTAADTEEAAAPSEEPAGPSPAKFEAEYYTPATPGLSIFHTQTQNENIDLPFEHTSPAETGITHMLAHNLKEYPSALHIVHFNGHGHGARYTGGLNGDIADKGLNQGTELGGRKADVVLLDSCFGGNWENLTRFADNAAFAVAFEDRIPASGSDKGRIPLTEMIKEASDETTARGVAVDLATVAGKFFDDPYDDGIAEVPLAERALSKHTALVTKGTDSTAAAIDLKVMTEQLNPALDAVGKAFSQELEGNKKFKAVLKQARKDNRIDGQNDQVDMGGFLESVAQSSSESVGEVVTSALVALDESIVTKRTGEKHPLSGLSFHSSPGARRRGVNGQLGSDPLANPDLPQNWVKFVETAF